MEEFIDIGCSVARYWKIVISLQLYNQVSYFLFKNLVLFKKSEKFILNKYKVCHQQHVQLYISCGSIFKTLKKLMGTINKNRLSATASGYCILDVLLITKFSFTKVSLVHSFYPMTIRVSSFYV